MAAGSLSLRFYSRVLLFLFTIDESAIIESMEFYYDDLVCVFRFELFTFVFTDYCSSSALWYLGIEEKYAGYYRNQVFYRSVTGHYILKKISFGVVFNVHLNEVMRFLYLLERLFIHRDSEFYLENDCSSCLNIVVDLHRFLSLEFSLVSVSFEDNRKIGRPKTMRINVDFGVRIMRDFYVEDVFSLDT